MAAEDKISNGLFVWGNSSPVSSDLALLDIQANGTVQGAKGGELVYSDTLNSGLRGGTLFSYAFIEAAKLGPVADLTSTAVTITGNWYDGLGAGVSFDYAQNDSDLGEFASDLNKLVNEYLKSAQTYLSLRANVWNHARQFKISSSNGTGAGTGVSVDGSGDVTLRLPSSISALCTGATNVTSKINGKDITSIFETDGTTVKKATHATNASDAGTANFAIAASSADSADNVTLKINGKNISSIFESNGTTAKKATNATTASKLGSSTLGGYLTPIYLSGGSPAACFPSRVGSAIVWVKHGFGVDPTAITDWQSAWSSYMYGYSARQYNDTKSWLIEVKGRIVWGSPAMSTDDWIRVSLSDIANGLSIQPISGYVSTDSFISVQVTSLSDRILNNTLPFKVWTANNIVYIGGRGGGQSGFSIDEKGICVDISFGWQQA